MIIKENFPQFDIIQLETNKNASFLYDKNYQNKKSKVIPITQIIINGDKLTIHDLSFRLSDHKEYYAFIDHISNIQPTEENSTDMFTYEILHNMVNILNNHHDI